MMKFYTTSSKISKASPDLLGGKGYGLWEMTKAGFPVPPAVIIPPAVCRAYDKDPEKVMEWVHQEVLPYADNFLSKELGYAPLLSVRSGAAVSMPGMMDTVLNVGLTDENEFFYRERLGSDCYEDCRKRLVEMYSDVVLGLDRSHFEGLDYATRLKRYWSLTGEAFPDAETQILNSIEAVFKSWSNPRAEAYRAHNGIPDKMGTAVILQVMVYGNSGGNSCTGVVFSRNPNHGGKEFYGEFLVNAQGEDIVAGTSTPHDIEDLWTWNEDMYTRLMSEVKNLENHRGDMQDIEFTIDNGKLWILQTRNGKRTAEAAMRIAIDLMDEERISWEEVCKRVKLADYLMATKIKLAGIPPTATGTGIAASSGIAIGRAVFSSAAALKCTDPCILIANETTPEDITGMIAAAGILTTTGGATSHAAVVARGMNTPAIVGVTGLEIKGELSAGYNGAHKIDVGDWVTLDGNTGRFWLGKALPVVNGSDLEVAHELRNLAREASESLKIALTYEDMSTEGCLIPVGRVEYLELHKMLAGMKSGVLDLRPAHTQDEASANIIDMFGGTHTDYVGLVEALKTALLHPNADLKLILPTGGKLPPELELDDRLTVIPTITGLDDLILATGPVFMDAFKAPVSSKAIEKLNALKAVAGEEAEAVILSSQDPKSFAKTDMQLLQEALA
jgi:pyruvate,orthophosphate dikinase